MLKFLTFTAKLILWSDEMVMIMTAATLWLVFLTEILHRCFLIVFRRARELAD